MNFTNRTPTEPGLYLWRQIELDMDQLVKVEQFTRDKSLLVVLGSGAERPLKGMTGEWCRLVPAEDVAKARQMALDEACRIILDQANKIWRGAHLESNHACSVLISKIEAVMVK